MALFLTLLAILLAGSLLFMSIRKWKQHQSKDWKPQSKSLPGVALMETARELAPEPLKTAEAKQTPGAPAPADPHSLPHSYGETRINVMARDPYWIFAYWEVSTERKEELRNRYGHAAWDSSCPVLRVYDVTGVYFFDSGRFFEIRINDYTSSWYINTGQAGHTYCVELGRLLPDGRFITIARSNPVTTPRDRVSELIDLEWLLPEDAEERLYRLPRGTGPSSPEFVKRKAEKWLQEEEQVSSPLKW